MEEAKLMLFLCPTSFALFEFCVLLLFFLFLNNCLLASIHSVRDGLLFLCFAGTLHIHIYHGGKSTKWKAYADMSLYF